MEIKFVFIHCHKITLASAVKKTNNCFALNGFKTNLDINMQKIFIKNERI